MPTKRRYTKRTKATAVIAAEFSTVAAASDELGIPETTLRQWYDSPEYVELRAKTREEQGDLTRALGMKVLMQIDRRLPEFEPRDLSVLYGILTDKGQLLTGQATSRHETVTEGWDDHEKVALREAIRTAVGDREA